MPMTMDGTPPSNSATKRTGATMRLLRYSDRKTAARMPTGTANAVASPTRTQLP